MLDALEFVQQRDGKPQRILLVLFEPLATGAEVKL